MRKLLAILFIGILFVGCSGSRGCGCPTWGNNDVDHQKVIHAQNKITSELGWVWN